MRLLLCDRADLSALWAYRGLRARGLDVQLVSADVLACALRWEHRLGADGISIKIELSGDRSIDGHSVQAVINRLVALPGGELSRAAERDREYAEQERVALFLSWLSALPAPVLNRPSPQGLCGRWLRVSEWLVLAARAGLPTPPYRRSSADRGADTAESQLATNRRRRTVLVVCGRATGAPKEIQSACCRLAELAGAAILGVRFQPGAAGPWTFADATPLPDLRLGGNQVLDLLHHALSNDGGGLA